MRQAHPARACALAVLQDQEWELQHGCSRDGLKKARIVGACHRDVNSSGFVALTSAAIHSFVSESSRADSHAHAYVAITGHLLSDTKTASRSALRTRH
jgi:hypothetical protein